MRGCIQPPFNHGTVSMPCSAHGMGALCRAPPPRFHPSAFHPSAFHPSPHSPTCPASPHCSGELYPVETDVRLCDELETGQEVEVDMVNDVLTNLTTGKKYSLKPLGDVSGLGGAQAGGARRVQRPCRWLCKGGGWGRRASMWLGTACLLPWNACLRWVPTFGLVPLAAAPVSPSCPRRCPCCAPDIFPSLLPHPASLGSAGGAGD